MNHERYSDEYLRGILQTCGPWPSSAPARGVSGRATG